MTNEKKSFLKKIITKVKKVYGYLNKDINKLKKAQSEDVQGGEAKHTNSAQESNDTQKNVFDIIDESQNENIEPEEKAVEEELIPEPEEIEEKTINASVPDDLSESAESDSEEINNTENAETKVVETENDSKSEIKNTVNEDKQTLKQEINVTQQDTATVNNSKQKTSTTPSKIENEVEETIETNSERKIKSIIRPDSVLSYLDDIVIQQENQKNKNKIQKVYKKNNNSHLIMPD